MKLVETYSDEFSRQNELVQIKNLNKSKPVRLEIETVIEDYNKSTLEPHHTIKNPNAKS